MTTSDRVFQPPQSLHCPAHCGDCDPQALQLVPVGVGLVDADNNRVTSEGQVALERLDYLGYALVDVEDQGILERFAGGEISLRQMIGELETE